MYRLYRSDWHLSTQPNAGWWLVVYHLRHIPKVILPSGIPRMVNQQHESPINHYLISTQGCPRCRIFTPFSGVWYWSGQKASSIVIPGYLEPVTSTQVTVSETKSSPLKSMLVSGVKCPFGGAYFKFRAEWFFVEGNKFWLSGIN